jgi:hypothetical protein
MRRARSLRGVVRRRSKPVMARVLRPSSSPTAPVLASERPFRTLAAAARSPVGRRRLSCSRRPCPCCARATAFVPASPHQRMRRDHSVARHHACVATAPHRRHGDPAPVWRAHERGPRSSLRVVQSPRSITRCWRPAPPPNPIPAGTMSGTAQVLLAHRLKQLKLPTVLRECDKAARGFARDSTAFARLATADRVRADRLRTARAAHPGSAVPGGEELRHVRLRCHPSLNRMAVLELARCEYLLRRDRSERV